MCNKALKKTNDVDQILTKMVADCMEDVCSGDRLKEALCAQAEAFVELCPKGTAPGEKAWRNELQCRKYLPINEN